MKFKLSEEVSGALHFGRPIVALESTVIAHGLPFPDNLETAYKLERLIRQRDCVPATIALFDGEVHIGLTDEHLEKLARGESVRKFTVRDLPFATFAKHTGATTVASSIFIARRAGIKVFATGGIGGVHRGERGDVSADLVELSRTQIVVVSSGAKIVLDLKATREWLETFGVTVLGWQSDEFPAFYSRQSGLKVDFKVDSAREVAKIAEAREDLEHQAAILVTVPIPEQFEIPSNELEEMLAAALKQAKEHRITGKDITPFLLENLAKSSDKRTTRANIALLENNAKVAAEIAKAIG
jgi:pseudouridine-5'-phosphate glycosidase